MPRYPLTITAIVNGTDDGTSLMAQVRHETQIEGHSVSNKGVPDE